MESFFLYFPLFYPLLKTQVTVLVLRISQKETATFVIDFFTCLLERHKREIQSRKLKNVENKLLH